MNRKGKYPMREGRTLPRVCLMCWHVQWFKEELPDDWRSIVTHWRKNSLVEAHVPEDGVM